MLVSERYILLRFSHCPAMLNRGADVGRRFVTVLIFLSSVRYAATAVPAIVPLSCNAGSSRDTHHLGGVASGFSTDAATRRLAEGRLGQAIRTHYTSCTPVITTSLLRFSRVRGRPLRL